jgi:hypothetical protein
MAAGVPQHRRGDVDADRGPAQAAHASGAHAGTAADLEASASSPAQQATERGIDAERIGPRRVISSPDLGVFLTVAGRAITVVVAVLRGVVPGGSG